MNVKRFALLASLMALAASRQAWADYGRSAYSYVREASGEVVVISPSNGEVQAKRNLPISAGDEMKTDDPARAEVALADGNVLHVGGGTRIRFVSLSAQQGSEGDVSAIDLSDGSVILSVVGADDRTVPRIDTADASIYANSGARVRVNTDVRRGTGVVVRAGSVEVKTRTGSYTVRAGNYLLVQGDQEPEIARGSFSRDRFDLWASDRLEATYDSPQSASSQYVGEDYSADIQSLDGYGDWDYNTTYSSYVWRPSVAVGWTPYSYGSWYYTPIGLSWWSYDPWGWYPHHYGNWFFDAGWNSWCWSPGYLYSPAWVYWGYTSNYFGWCPVGYYGFYSPWWNDYYKNIGWTRDSVLAVNGRFSTRQVDMRGWNFTGVHNVGTRRMDVVAGTRVVDRLGGNISVSSRPIVLSERSGNTRDALRDYVREAPRLIERTTNPRDSERLAPVLSRERQLPDDTVQALRERTAVAQRGRLVGPGASELTSRSGGAAVERGRVPLQTEPRRTESVDRSSPGSAFDRGRTVNRAERPSTPATRANPSDSWRGQSQARSSETRPQADRQIERPERQGDRERSTTGSEWRGRPAPASPVERGSARPETSDRPARDGWRSRPEVPPAQRVIEGSVPGRRPADRDPGDAGSRRGYDRQAPQASPRQGQPRNDGGRAPAPREYAPRSNGNPNPNPGVDRGRSNSAPRQAAPRSYDRAPAPRSAPQAAPPRSAPAPAPRSAPPPSSGSRGRP
jgi:hypothetical protein